MRHSRQMHLTPGIFSGMNPRRSALMISGTITAFMLISSEAWAACNLANGNIVCNGDFESFQPVPGSDEVIFDNWVSSDPASLRVGRGAGGTNSSVEFLFSPEPFSQNLSTVTGDRYKVAFQYRSEGGQSFAAFFGDVKIFEFSGDEAGSIDWTEYSFNVQAFGSNTALRFVAASFGVAQNIDLVSVIRCTSCASNEPDNLAAVIDKSQPFFTTRDEAGRGTAVGNIRTATLDGGTLRPPDSEALGTPVDPLTVRVQVTSNGGIVDNAGQGFALTGQILNTASSATPFIITGAGGGTVAGAITNNGTLVVSTTGTTNIDGPVINSPIGQLVVSSGGSARVNGTLSGGNVIVQNGTLSVAGAVSAPIDVARNGELRGTGAVSGATTIAGTLRPGSSPGTLSFSSPVSQTAGSTLVIEIDGPGTGQGAGNYSRVVVNGSGNSYTIANGVTLIPVLRGISFPTGTAPAGNQYNLTLGQRLEGVIQAQGGVFGTFSSVIQPTGGLPAGTRIIPLYSATSVDLFVSPASYGSYGGITQNQAAVGGAIDALILTGATVSRPLVSAIVPLGATAISPALSSLSGQSIANLPLAAVEASHAFTDQIGVRRSQFAQASDGLQFWGWVFGNTAKTSSDGNNPGFLSRLAGGILGVDFASASGLRAGIAGGFGGGNVRAADGNGRAELRSYYAGGYLGIQKTSLSVNAQLGVNFNNFGNNRTVSVGALSRSANADIDGKTTSAALDIGYRIKTGSFTIEPIGFARYDTVKVSDFIEEGADVFALTVNNRRYSRLSTGVGARLRAEIATANGAVIQPEAHASWRHELKDPRYALTMSLAGQSFAVQSGAPGRDAALLGASIGAQLSAKLRLVAAYDVELARNRTGHDMSAQLRMQW